MNPPPWVVRPLGGQAGAQRKAARLQAMEVGTKWTVVRSLGAGRAHRAAWPLRREARRETSGAERLRCRHTNFRPPSCVCACGWDLYTDVTSSRATICGPARVVRACLVDVARPYNELVHTHDRPHTPVRDLAPSPLPPSHTRETCGATIVCGCEFGGEICRRPMTTTVRRRLSPMPLTKPSRARRLSAARAAARGHGHHQL